MPQPTHLTALQQNARTLRGNGDLAGARLMLEQGLEVAKGSLGEDHPEVLSTAHVLAGMHREAGDPAAARRVLEEAVAAGQLRFSDGEPLMLALSYSLGTVADELGNRHEARRNFGRVASAGPAVLGQDHAWVRAARDYLGADSGPESAPPAQSPAARSPATQPPAPAASPPLRSTPPAAQLGTPPAGPPNRRPAAQPNTPPAAQPSTAPAFQSGQPQPAPALHAPAYHPPVYHSQRTPFDESPQYVTFGPGIGVNPAPVHIPEPALAPQPARRSRGATVAAAVAAVAAVVAVGVAAAAVLFDRGTPSSQPPQGQGASSAPAAQALPPERVRISDDGNVVTLTWTDPSDGTVPFFIAGSRAGEQQRIMGQAKPGETRYPLNGLKSSLNYCFVVIAVYSSDQLVPSEQVCTNRSARPSRPSTSSVGADADADG